MILTEFSPFTPESDSITLSRMFCEKFQSTPTRCLRQVGVHRPRPVRPWCADGVRPGGHRAIRDCGSSGTKNSAL